MKFLSLMSMRSISMMLLGDDCFDEVLILLDLGQAPVIENPTEIILSCGEIAEFPEPEGIDIDDYEYNTEEDGSGDSYFAGDEIPALLTTTSTIYLIATSDNGCSSISEITMVTDSSVVEFSVEWDELICSDSIILPDISPDISFTFYFTEPGGAGDSYLPGEVIHAPYPDTLYIFNPWYTIHCSDQDTLPIIHVQGTNTDLPHDTTVCEFIILPDFGGTHGANIRYAQFPVSDPNSSFYPGDTLDYSQLLYILDTIGNCIFYDSMEVNIIVEPDIGSDTSLILCEGFESSSFDLMELLSFPDVGGQWNYPNVPDLETADSSNLMMDVLQVGNYTFNYIIEDSTCGLFSSDISIEVIQGPYGGENADIDLCVGSSIDLMALISDPDTGGYWEQIMGPEMVDISDSSSVDLSNILTGRYGFLYVIEGDSYAEFCDGESSSLFVNLGQQCECWR